MPTLLFSLLIVQAEPSVTALKPTLGAVYDVSKETCTKWAEAFEHLQKTNGQVEGYEYPDRFDEALGGPWETISDGCSWYCGGQVETVSASSTLSQSKSASYTHKNLHDSDIRTAWVEGKPDHGVGESVSFKAYGAVVEQISIWNGYQKSPSLYIQNSRAKTLKLYVNDAPLYLLHLEDTRAVQYFTISPINVQTAPATLRFEIVEVYPGSKWADTAISEINFDGSGVH